MFLGWQSVSEEQVISILSDLQIIFSDKDNWIDFPISIDKNGSEVDPLSQEADKFSLMGASYRLAKEKYPEIAQFVDCATREMIFEMTDGKWRNLSYEEEIGYINSAIEFLKKEKEK
jgi:hypothetical protein